MGLLSRKSQFQKTTLRNYKEILKVIKKTHATHNPSFEIIPAMYILADLAAINANKDRVAMSNEFIDVMLENGYLKQSDLSKFDTRIELYGEVVRGKIEPIGLWWLGEDSAVALLGGHVLSKVLTVFGDLLIDEAKQNDYLGPMTISDIFSVMTFAETMIRQIVPAMFDYYKVTFE